MDLLGRRPPQRKYSMRTRYRYDPDLDAVVEIRNNYFDERAEGPNVIRDDVGAGVNGLMHFPSGKMLDSKSAHYRESRARGVEHVGGETAFAGKKISHDARYYGQQVKDAVEQIAGNYNGTADWLARQRERSGR